MIYNTEVYFSHPHYQKMFESYLSLRGMLLINAYACMTSVHFYLGLAAPARLEFMVIKNAILTLYIYQATRACVGGGACRKQKAGSWKIAFWQLENAKM
jgi:hypothetical protein